MHYFVVYVMYQVRIYSHLAICANVQSYESYLLKVIYMFDWALQISHFCTRNEMCFVAEYFYSYIYS